MLKKLYQKVAKLDRDTDRISNNLENYKDKHLNVITKYVGMM